MTVSTELRSKPLIDELAEKADEGALEAQVHFLCLNDKRLLGSHSLMCFALTPPDPGETQRVVIPDEMFPEAALPLWASFYRHELISNNGTEHDPRYITTRHRFGELAVNTGLGEFQPISAIAKADTLPPGLKLLLSFYRLDQSRNSFGPQHPVPRELFNLAKQHHLADELEAFRRQIPSDGRNDLNFLARYTQFLIAAADAEDPRIINGARFWQETQTEAKLITGKASRT